MKNIDAFIQFEEFNNISLMKQTKYAKITIKTKPSKAYQKYIFKTFLFDCVSTKSQKIILETFQQIRSLKSQYLQCYEGISFVSTDCVFNPTFSMKYISSTTLADLIKRPTFSKEWKLRDGLYCLFAVAEGLSYLHKQLIYHGNLCPSNIIVDISKQCYLCDFQLYPIKKLYISNRDIADEVYREPSSLNREPLFSDDIYSYGVLMCQLCFSFLQPSTNESLSDFIKKYDPNKFNNFHPFFKDLIPKCLNLSSRERPTFSKILELFQNDQYGINRFFDTFKKLNYIEKLANKNDPFALNKLGGLYDKGKIVDHDSQKALFYYEKAASLNNSEAQNNFGVMLQEETGKNNENLKKGAELLRLSAEQGNMHGMANYGIALKKGDGVKIDFVKAKQYLKKSADLGYSYAQINYCFILLENVNKTSNDICEALKYLKMAIGQNDPEALYSYGILLNEGEIIDKNEKLALEYFKKAADMGHKMAIEEYEKRCVKDEMESNLEKKSVQKKTDFVDQNETDFYVSSQVDFTVHNSISNTDQNKSNNNSQSKQTKRKRTNNKKSKKSTKSKQNKKSNIANNQNQINQNQNQFNQNQNQFNQNQNQLNQNQFNQNQNLLNQNQFNRYQNQFNQNQINQNQNNVSHSIIFNANYYNHQIQPKPTQLFIPPYYQQQLCRQITFPSLPNNYSGFNNVPGIIGGLQMLLNNFTKKSQAIPQQNSNTKSSVISSKQSVNDNQANGSNVKQNGPVQQNPKSMKGNVNVAKPTELTSQSLRNEPEKSNIKMATELPHHNSEAKLEDTNIKKTTELLQQDPQNKLEGHNNELVVEIEQKNLQNNPEKHNVEISNETIQRNIRNEQEKHNVEISNEPLHQNLRSNPESLNVKNCNEPIQRNIRNEQGKPNIEISNELLQRNIRNEQENPNIEISNEPLHQNLRSNPEKHNVEFCNEPIHINIRNEQEKPNIEISYKISTDNLQQNIQSFSDILNIKLDNENLLQNSQNKQEELKIEIAKEPYSNDETKESSHSDSKSVSKEYDIEAANDPSRNNLKSTSEEANNEITADYSQQNIQSLSGQPNIESGDENLHQNSQNKQEELKIEITKESSPYNESGILKIYNNEITTDYPQQNIQSLSGQPNIESGNENLKQNFQNKQEELKIEITKESSPHNERCILEMDNNGITADLSQRNLQSYSNKQNIESDNENLHQNSQNKQEEPNAELPKNDTNIDYLQLNLQNIPENSFQFYPTNRVELFNTATTEYDQTQIKKRGSPRKEIKVNGFQIDINNNLETHINTMNSEYLHQNANKTLEAPNNSQITKKRKIKKKKKNLDSEEFTLSGSKGYGKPGRPRTRIEPSQPVIKRKPGRPRTRMEPSQPIIKRRPGRPKKNSAEEAVNLNVANIVNIETTRLLEDITVNKEVTKSNEGSLETVASEDPSKGSLLMNSEMFF